ncbi:MAG: CRTAC1 family protein [Chloroflexota bacterium]|nr:CRTAC1 family protein [Chloroflexota bacterium]
MFRSLPFCLIPLALMLVVTNVASALRIYAPVTLESVALRRAEDCSGAFLAHELDHITTPTSLPIGFYDSNGAGLAINDLNNDGLLDIVLANLGGDNAVFWNVGGLQFRKQALPSLAPSRAVATVDVDGDGWLDIVFTQQAAAPLYWRNQKGTGFAIQVLTGVSYIGYAMNWLDVDRDGDLDLLTGSYDVENEMILGQSGPKSGLIYYEQGDDRFQATRIANRSNTLALLSNINAEGDYEIIIGNDFAVPDRYFTFVNGNWQEAEPPPVMPHSTMSYDAADLDNDGLLEVYAVDMKPYADDEETEAQWAPVMDMMMAMPHVDGDPQIMENVLYAGAGAGLATNIAPRLGLDATGWSWSTKFGDLDNDGFQDLYVVNGMISREMFSHLPGNELVEENQVYRNHSGSQFVPQPGWGLNDRASGRGMSLADLDNDGDLDVIVNNLNAPAKVFENQLCGGDSIEVDLHWGLSASAGVGAQLILKTGAGAYRRDITVSSGYLSGDPSRVHFGFVPGTILERLTIIWNDGEYSAVDELRANTLITVERE